MNLQIERAAGDLLANIRQHCEDFHYLKRWPDPRSPHRLPIHFGGQ